MGQLERDAKKLVRDLSSDPDTGRLPRGSGLDCSSWGASWLWAGGSPGSRRRNGFSSASWQARW